MRTRSRQRRAGFVDDPTAASTTLLQEFSVGLDLVLDRAHAKVVSEDVVMLGTPYATVDYGSWKEPGASPSLSAQATPAES